MTEIAFKKIHKHSYNNRLEIEASDRCGCFHCLEIFSPDIINDKNWYSTTEPPIEQTLFCPKCGIDSVIGSASGYELNSELLNKLRKYFFNTEYTRIPVVINDALN